MPAASSSRLQIDTSIARLAAGPSSGRSSHGGGITPGSTLNKFSLTSQRMRSASTASSSSLSVPNTARASVSPAVFSVSDETDSINPGHSRSSTDTASDESDELAQDYVLAMHDFEPDGQNVTCLAFRAGQVIHVLNRHTSGWWDGELDGKRGWFPSNYVTNEVSLLTEEELPASQVRQFVCYQVLHSYRSSHL